MFICEFECEVCSYIDKYDDECWRATGTDAWGAVVEVADGATREDAVDNVIALLTYRYRDMHPEPL